MTKKQMKDIIPSSLKEQFISKIGEDPEKVRFRVVNKKCTECGNDRIVIAATEDGSRFAICPVCLAYKELRMREKNFIEKEFKEVIPRDISFFRYVLNALERDEDSPISAIIAVIVGIIIFFLLLFGGIWLAGKLGM